MISTIKFNELSTMLLDFVDHQEGFLYLRMVGVEPVVNAIWAKLSSSDSRGKKWGSEVSIPMAGQAYPQYVAAQKHVTYRTLRTRLPGGLIDLALVHPMLTVAEDTIRGFYLLSYDAGVPSGFFDRLNKSLSIPLQPEWETWLWEQGQRPQSRLTLATKEAWEAGKPVQKTELTETTEIPITRLTSLGSVSCYTILCQERYRDAWLQIIRQQLKLGSSLKKTPHSGGDDCYLDGRWAIYPSPEGWTLHHDDERMAEAPSLNFLLTQARETLGVHFIIMEEES